MPAVAANELLGLISKTFLSLSSWNVLFAVTCLQTCTPVLQILRLKLAARVNIPDSSSGRGDDRMRAEHSFVTIIKPYERLTAAVIITLILLFAGTLTVLSHFGKTEEQVRNVKTSGPATTYPLYIRKQKPSAAACSLLQKSLHK